MRGWVVEMYDACSDYVGFLALGESATRKAGQGGGGERDASEYKLIGCTQDHLQQCIRSF
jgi:hypothetical protein